MPTADLRRRLVELDAAIFEQKDVLAALERDKIAVQQELDDTATFPILTLPVEITTEIFTWCLPTIQELRRDHRFFEDEELPGTLQAPLSLASCCRAWRAIAIATPHLWTTFPLFLEAVYRDSDQDSDSDESDDDLDANGTTKSKRENLTKFIDRWLSRAAQRPLTFVFSIAAPGPQHDYRGPACTSLHHVEGVMERYAGQLEHLDLTASFHNAFSLVGMSGVEFPLLQRVVLAGFPDDEYYIPDPIDLFRTGAPQFRELCLRETDFQLFPISLSSYYFPSDQLTRFEGRIDELLLFWHGSKLIEVKCRLDPGEVFEESQEITLLNLQSLTLSSADSNAIPFLLGHLTLPALLSLHLSDADCTDPASLSPFLERSKPPLRFLSIRVDEYHIDPWNHCFAAVGPTLQTLEIHSPSISFMHSFLTRATLPRLNSLTLMDCPEADYKDLMAFLYKRSTSPELAKLQHFRLEHYPGILLDEHLFHIEGDDESRTLSEHVLKLGRDGMSIHIGSESKTLISIGST
ncbi:hypothetical protein B0H16DRAFT_1568289 [Mycena metata]|uniref:F-box domain-containing protein n=1 Tax=Mycena metata TaxID=1033252 RepID=A0AAD7ICD3_9AGAR|nr:hypothetical protein B0H16DRAFT_1568289 [Mycena metata]